MEMTATRLEIPKKRINFSSIAVGLAPLAVVFALFAFKTDLLIPASVEEVKPIYYPAVAVVFVASSSEMRDVSFKAKLNAERRVALRAEERSRVVSVQTKVGATVSAGDAVCRIRPVGGETLVLFSPIDGVVRSVNASAGTVLEAGEPCLTIFDPQSLVATGEMTPRQAQVIIPGDPAQVLAKGAATDSAVRVVYPDTDADPDNNLTFEVAVTGANTMVEGQAAEIVINTEQVLPMLVPFRALILVQGKGMAARIVTGSGPTGRVKTLPITIVATTRDGFYVDGLPVEARLIVEDPMYEVPEDGEMVRIGQVG
ncbi:MAG: HlyD family efflux transporter periplasmic adaptor subunit [Pseudomonadota bacterium]